MIEETAVEKKTESQPEKDASKSKYKRKRIILPIILATIGVIAGMHFYYQAITYVSTDDAFVESHIIRISPKVSGIIKKVYVDDNQKVKKGDILAEIDPQDYQVRYEQALAKLQVAIEQQKSASTNVDFTSITSNAAVDQAASGLGAAKASMQVADKQISQAKANLAQVNEDIQAVKADVDLAKTDFDRYQKLYKKGVVSKQDFDKASTTYKSIKAKLNSYQEKAAAAEAIIQSAYANKEVATNAMNQAMGKLKGAQTVPQQIAMSDAGRKIAAAEIRQLKAGLKQSKLDLSYTKIYAPQDGSVTSKSVEEGAFVQTGQPLLSVIPQKNWVIANFKETQLTKMKAGQPVFIKVDTYPGKVFKGHVDSIQYSTGSKTSLFPPENASGSFVKVVQRVPVKILFDEKPTPAFVIVPGMSVVPNVKVR